jgi:hypothetical protein
VAAVPDAALFRSGRQFAAWTGLTPRPHSSGGKRRLGGIGRRRDGNMRRPPVTAAAAAGRAPPKVGRADRCLPDVARIYRPGFRVEAPIRRGLPYLKPFAGVPHAPITLATGTRRPRLTTFATRRTLRSLTDAGATMS